MQYIGKLDKSKIGDYKYKIVTDDIVLTEERKKHIYDNHRKDYKKIIRSIKMTVLNPSEIIKDIRNKDTLFFINKLEINNLNVVVKLNTNNSKEHPQNSIMTAWIIRDSNLRKLRDKNKTIYKKE